MAVAGEALPLNDSFIVKLDIEDSPSAEIPLTDLYDMVSSSLLENYRAIIQDTVVQILEDTMWINATMMTAFLNAPFSIFDIRDGGLDISLWAQGLQRFVSQAIAARAVPLVDLRLPLLIRFKSPDVTLPKPPSAPIVLTESTPPVPDLSGVIGQAGGPPSNVATSTELLQQVSALGAPGSPSVQQQQRTRFAPSLESASDAADTEVAREEGVLSEEPPPASSAAERTASSGGAPHTGPKRSTTGTHFRGHAVDVDPTPHNQRQGRASAPSYDDRSGGHDTASSRRGRLFDHSIERTPAALVRTPTRSHPFIEEVTFGAETFQDYMGQFQYSEVKYKDFRKVVIPTFNARANDSFVHWYKLLVSICLQWGVWCPPTNR